MTKMSTPEMDVIRFSESDVIVASGVVGKTLSISGVGDGDKGNAFLTIGGIPYSSNQVVNYTTGFSAAYNDYMSGLSTYSTGTMLHHSDGNNSLTINGAFMYDAGTSTSDSYNAWVNGSYVWRDGSWHHQ